MNGELDDTGIDKVTARSAAGGAGGVSREGVQRDLLPLIEGTTVAPSMAPSAPTTSL